LNNWQSTFVDGSGDGNNIHHIRFSYGSTQGRDLKLTKLFWNSDHWNSKPSGKKQTIPTFNLLRHQYELVSLAWRGHTDKHLKHLEETAWLSGFHRYSFK
jgi:hypothetical protein